MFAAPAARTRGSQEDQKERREEREEGENFDVRRACGARATIAGKKGEGEGEGRRAKAKGARETRGWVRGAGRLRRQAPKLLVRVVRRKRR